MKIDSWLENKQQKRAKILWDFKKKIISTFNAIIPSKTKEGVSNCLTISPTLGQFISHGR